MKNHQKNFWQSVTDWIKNRKIFTLIIIILIVILIGLLIFRPGMKPNYHTYSQINEDQRPTQVLTRWYNKHYAKKDTGTIVIVLHKTGCSLCKKAQKTITKGASQSPYQTVSFDIAKNNLKTLKLDFPQNLWSQNNVIHTPTVVRFSMKNRKIHRQAISIQGSNKQLYSVFKTAKKFH